MLRVNGSVPTGSPNTWTAQQTFEQPILIPAGSVSAPGLAFSAQTDMGLHRVATNTLVIQASANNGGKYRITNSQFAPYLAADSGVPDLGQADRTWKDFYTSGTVVSMTGLPTTDPMVAGQLWIDTGASRVVKASAGP